MYNKRRFKNDGKKFKVKGDPERFLAENKRKTAGQPSPKEDSVDMGFQRRAFKDITQGSMSIAINPAGEVSFESDPYAVVNRTNVIVDAKYRGADNTSGSIVPSLADGSTSTFRHVTDMIGVSLDVNYAYCKFKATDNADSRVNTNMYKPYNSVLESIRGEAYTDLPFFNWKVSGTNYSGDGLLDLILTYQATVQQVHLVAQTYINTRSLEKHLKDMCFEGEGASKLNDMFGRIKKAAFVNQIKGIADETIYFYTDSSWWKQVNMLLSIPCRKSNSMIDPLIVIQPRYHCNDGLTVKDADNQTLFTTQDCKSLIDDCVLLNGYLDPIYMMNMARSEATTSQTITTWFNNMSDRVGAIISSLNTFVKDFKEMHTAFKRLSNIQITEWKTGLFVAIENIDAEYQPKFNKLAYDIVRSLCTGSNRIEYNTKINQWVSCSLWDLFLGIPSYDYKSGGCTLTFSSHSAYRPSGTPSTVIYPALYNPVAVSEEGIVSGAIIRCLTRSNRLYWIKPEDFTFSSSTELVRLVPLTSYNSTQFKAPVIQRMCIDYSGSSSSIGDFANIGSDSNLRQVASWALFTLAKLFGYARLISGATTNPQTQVTTYTYSDNIETDALCFIDVVIDDQTNAVKSFCRAHSPFRTVKTTLDEKLGFEVSKSIAAFRQKEGE